MASVERFEDLIAWRKARALAGDIYRVTRAEAFRRDYGLASQIQRAAVSVMANLAEGFERRRKVEFHRYVEIAKGSCAEVASHLYIARDIGYLEEADFDGLLVQTHELQRVLGGLRASLAPAMPGRSGLGTRASELELP